MAESPASGAIGRRTFLGAAGAATAAAMLVPATANAITPDGGRGSSGASGSASTTSPRRTGGSRGRTGTAGRSTPTSRTSRRWAWTTSGSCCCGRNCSRTAPTFAASKLDRLEELLDLADARDLDGAVSGVLFVPPYLISNSNGRIRNVLTDPIAIEREQWVLGQVAARIGNHRRFLGFDLSNEIHWFAIPLQMAATQAQGDAWHDTLFSTCEQVAPGKIHVSGIDHWPWQNNAYWTRHGLGTAGTMTANHTWAGWTGVIQNYGSLSTASTHYSEYFIEVIKAFHTNLQRQVWIEDRCLGGLDGRCRHPDLDRAVDPHHGQLRQPVRDHRARAARRHAALVRLLRSVHEAHRPGNQPCGGASEPLD